MKSGSIFLCDHCGNEFPKWSGQCPACHQWNSLKEISSLIRPRKSRSAKSHSAKAAILSPTEALKSQKDHVFSTNISEFDRVLGKGLTQGGVYLIAGQPGIGKSTLLTQLALSAKKKVAYVCSEENPAQVATRIKRLSKVKNSQVELIDSSDVDSIINSLKPNTSLLIVDSIQSVYSPQNPTTAGSMTQIRDSATFLIQLAKKTNLPVILVGHVTKSGQMAGPKLLEHMVDTVLYLEGDRQHELRILRAVKNRFGPSDESGIFRMSGLGLETVADPSSYLLEGRLANTAGSALAMTMQGSRPLTAEIQALVTPTPIPIPRRVAKGISQNRLQLICAILVKHLSLKIADKDVFINVTGGLKLDEPGADLAIALSIISSAKNKALPASSICFGELGLLGEIRNVSFQDKRTKEAKNLGYKSILSSQKFKRLKDIRL